MRRARAREPARFEQWVVSATHLGAKLFTAPVFREAQGAEKSLLGETRENSGQVVRHPTRGEPGSTEPVAALFPNRSSLPLRAGDCSMPDPVVSQFELSAF